MALIGTPRSFHKRFKFLIEVDGFARAGFNKASELKVEAKPIEYWEGANLVPNKSPGRLEFSKLTLERGATNDLDFYNWFQQVAIASASVGLVDNEYKRNMELVQLDRDGSELRRWLITGAWVCMLKVGEWSATEDEVVIESIEVAYDWFELVA
jgi:phage tail-like protein